MQEATCTLKSPAVHHGWAVPSTPEADSRPEKASSASPVEAQERQQSEASLNAVVSSLGRLALSSTDASPSAVPVSVVTSAGYAAWPPVDGDLLQSSGLLCTTAAPGLQNTSMVSGAVGANGLRSPFSSSTSQLLQQQSVPRRAITGHASVPVPPESFGAVPSTAASRPAWNNQAQAVNWLQASRPGPLPTRFGGSVHHGRSMSVQNINMTGNSSIQSRKSSSNQYGNGMFGTVPSMSGYTGQSRSPYLPQVDQMGLRYSDIDEKAVLGGLNQEAVASAGLEAQWLDLIRSAVQDQFRAGASGANFGWPANQQLEHNRQQAKVGKLPYGFLDNNAGGAGSGVMGGLDSASLEKQLALSAAFGGAAGLAAFGGSERVEVYSRKVFVGGLPPDIDEDEIMSAFRRFGPLVVDWPHKAESKSYFPPKGYCFLLFQDELSVQALVEACTVDENKLYWCVSSPTMKDKPVQVRPWSLSDADFVMDGSQPLDPRKTVFVGGVPRPLRAVELALIMGRLYGGVCYAGIDTDPELRYPKGAGRVAFSSQQSYIAAISARFVQLQHGDIDKRVEVKPYVLDDQICDECAGVHSGGKFAPFFCANVTCLQYYCEPCWARIHSAPGREFHKPLVKEGADRPRAMPFRWC